MTPLPPHAWLRASLPPKLAGAAGETFIAILEQPESIQRAAFELGVRYMLEGGFVERRLHLVTDEMRSDADELLEPTRFVDDGFDTIPPSGPPDSAA